MKLSELSYKELSEKLSTSGLTLEIGPFSAQVRSPLPVVAEGLSLLYGEYLLCKKEDFIDFHIELKSPRYLRQWLRPQASFYFDGQNPFKPLPQNQAFAMFEWGLNWCIANNAHHYLIIHAAVVEKRGFALILPGSPGSGKSTLCAALTGQGWRLLSDEMALISIENGKITPVPRPISLKNKSIDVIRKLSDNVVMSSPVHDTAKGSVAHMQAPADSLAAKDSPAIARLLIFPKYTQGAKTSLTPLSKGRSFVKIAENGFNYNVLGKIGFDLLAKVIEHSACFDLSYERMDEAIELIDGLVDAL